MVDIWASFFPAGIMGGKAEQFKSLFVFVELGGSGFSLAFKISDWKLLEG